MRIEITNYSGEGPELVSYEPTATGLRVTIRPPLSFILQGDTRSPVQVVHSYLVAELAKASRAEDMATKDSVIAALDLFERLWPDDSK